MEQQERTCVVAHGDNALGNTPQEQLSLVEKTASPLVETVGDGNGAAVLEQNKK